MAIDLLGRYPPLRRAVSGRLAWVVGFLGVVFLVFLVMGIVNKSRQQARMKEHTQVATLAFDAAEAPPSARGDAPMATSTPPSGPPIGPAPGAPAPANPTPVVAAPGAQPVPAPTAPAQYQPGYTPQQPVAITPRQRELMREQQAIDAPTGVSQQGVSQQQPAQSTIYGGSQPQIDPGQQYMNDMLRAATQVPQVPAGTYPPATAIPAQGVPMMDPTGQNSDPNQQGQKSKFSQGEDSKSDYLKTTRMPPLSRYVLQRETKIPAQIPDQLVSDLPGDVQGIVTRDVYDSPTQKILLIPAGSRLIGEYNSRVSYGQGRAQVAWVAIYYPDGSYTDFDRFPAHAADGATGLHDQTDNHWKRLIAGVALSSVLSAGLQISQNRANNSALTYPSTGEVAASAVGTQATELGQQITQRNLNLQPTLKIRPGQIFDVRVTKDMVFPGPYVPMVAQ